MKKTLSVLLAVILVFGTASTAFAAETPDAMITADWVILADKNDTEQAKYAVEKLQSVLSDVFGKALPIVNEADKNYIAVGSAADCNISGIGKNGYRILVNDGNVLIKGTEKSGVVTGVYRFLEEFAGRKVYTWDIIKLPKAEKIVVPADTDIIYEPYFESTSSHQTSPGNAEYCLANGISGNGNLSEAQGGNIDYLNGIHTLVNQFCNPDTYFGSHPEYFALHGGERNPGQLCLTNPEVIEIVTDEVLSILKANHNPDAPLQIVRVQQADNQNFCECENCKALEAKYGGVHSASMINFINQIADTVKEKGYENVAVQTFAYTYTRQAPVGLVPHDNVIIELCSIECCFAHALDDPNCPNNVKFMKDLDDWAKICNRLYIWDYTTNYSNTVGVFPDFGTIQKNARVFYTHNVKGVFEEGNYYVDKCDSEFGELRAYIIAKSLQDPYRDLNDDINGFLDAYYGPGGCYIRNIVDTYVEHAGNKDGHLDIYCDSADSMTMKNYTVSQINDWWQQAKDAAETEEQLARVKRSEVSWIYYKANAKKDQFSLTNPKRFDEKVRLYEMFEEYGIHVLSEGNEYDDYKDCISVKFTIPDEWDMYEPGETGAETRNFFGEILEFLIPFLTGFGLMYKIHKALMPIHF